MRAHGGQSLPRRRAADLQVVLIRDFRVGNRDLSLQSSQQRACASVRYVTEPPADDCVYHRVDAAHKKAGDTGNCARVTAMLDEAREAVDIGLRDFLIPLDA